jgi:hypothetical protein
MKLTDMKMTPPKLLLLGDPGTGKTALACTLGAHAQVLDLDNGLRTALTLKDSFYDARTSIDVLSCAETDASKALAFQRTRAYLQDIQRASAAGKWPFKALVLDSWTALAEASVRHIMAASGKLGAQPQIQQWGMAFLELENILAILKALPCLTIVIAHLQRSEEDGVMKATIASPGQKLPAKIPMYFDEIWVTRPVTQAGKTSYTLQTKASAGCIARSRCNLPDGSDVGLGLPELLRRAGYDIEKE